MKNSKQIEKHIKGMANHRRIDILLLVSKSHRITLDDIAKTLDCNFKTISGHTLKLVNAGLVDKNYNGRTILHSLSPCGKIFVKFIENFKKL
jgi:predicted ArsR family transcriptional regulator